MIKLKNILNESKNSQIISKISKIAKSFGFKEVSVKHKFVDQEDGIVNVKAFVDQRDPKWPWVGIIYYDENTPNELWFSFYVAKGGGSFYNDPAIQWTRKSEWDSAINSEE